MLTGGARAVHRPPMTLAVATASGAETPGRTPSLSPAAARTPTTRCRRSSPGRVASGTTVTQTGRARSGTSSPMSTTGPRSIPTSRCRQLPSPLLRLRRQGPSAARPASRTRSLPPRAATAATAWPGTSARRASRLADLRARPESTGFRPGPRGRRMSTAFRPPPRAPRTSIGFQPGPRGQRASTAFPLRPRALRTSTDLRRTPRAGQMSTVFPLHPRGTRMSTGSRPGLRGQRASTGSRLPHRARLTGPTTPLAPCRGFGNRRTTIH